MDNNSSNVQYSIYKADEKLANVNTFVNTSRVLIADTSRHNTSGTYIFESLS